VTAATNPRCIVIAGPNGAGKTTFARDYLPNAAGVVHFINADLIAGGLSPVDPRLAAVAAARLVLSEMKRLAAGRARPRDVCLRCRFPGQSGDPASPSRYRHASITSMPLGTW
jgi:ABC-type cobalamin/Fe3+-siderophores transport system ATPase subunit